MINLKKEKTCYLLLEQKRYLLLYFAEFAQSRADFLSKYSIALKEASETRYWIQLMIENDLASKSKFSLMLEELNQIIKILIATTKKLKEQ